MQMPPLTLDGWTWPLVDEHRTLTTLLSPSTTMLHVGDLVMPVGLVWAHLSTAEVLKNLFFYSCLGRCAEALRQGEKLCFTGPVPAEKCSCWSHLVKFSNRFYLISAGFCAVSTPYTPPLSSKPFPGFPPAALTAPCQFSFVGFLGTISITGPHLFSLNAVSLGNPIHSHCFSYYWSVGCFKAYDDTSGFPGWNKEMDLPSEPNSAQTTGV